MTCKRPNCTRFGRDYYIGLCRTHYNQYLRSLAEQGGYQLGLVDMAEVAIHIEKLRNIGLGIDRIAIIAGVDRRNLCRALNRGQIRGSCAKKILDIPLDWRLAADAAKIPNVGTMRRLQALNAIGYSYNLIGKHLGGVEVSNVWKYISGRQKSVTTAFARRVEKVFHELQLHPSLDNSYPTRQARAHAQSKGWAPPLAWDEHAIDDPNAEPFAVARRVTHHHDMDEYNELRDMGLTDRAIAERWEMEYASLRQLLLRIKRRQDAA
jgi:hypothetical protein